MLDRKYDPTKPYYFIKYGRMSDPKQNKRSPEQQFATIDEVRKRCGYPWHCVGDYRDDGVSGRYVAKRAGLQRMLRDIESHQITIDLIAVDTYERLGRAEEIAEIRRRLFTDYGVLVVTSDNNFADPTGIIGKAVGLVESIRSTEDTRIKRHNVIRGKKDAARLRHWPGGPAPFGYRLTRVIDESGAGPTVYQVLEPEPREAAAMRMAFQRAFETGEGTTRLSQWWNANPEIPDEFKPISAFTVGYRLQNPIYVGTLVWGANRTGVVNDTRVVEPNSEEEVLRIPGFCTPLVSEDLYNTVLSLMQARGRQIKKLRRKSANGGEAKLIAPQTRGLTLKYLLTGLVRCGCCNASMRPVASGATSKSGRRYTYYTCPRHIDGACGNSRHIPESALRDFVTSRLRARLFPPSELPGEVPAWLPEMVNLVQQELQHYREDEPGRQAAIVQELDLLAGRLSGWAITLSNPQLPPGVRADIEGKYEESRLRQQDLQQIVAHERALEQHVEETLDPKLVIELLLKLSEVLATYNPTLGNLELSRHIERIDCFPDGRVVVRGTLLGVSEGGHQLLSRDGDCQSQGLEPQPSQQCKLVVPRRRARVRVPNLTAESQRAIDNIDASLDPRRFAGLPETLFWTESFVISRKVSWAEEHAEEVYQAKLDTGLSFNELVNRFRKSRPTLQHAWRIATARRQATTPMPDEGVLP